MSGRSSYYPQTPNKRPPNRRQQTKNCLKHNALTILTVLGVVGGIVLGLLLRNARSTNWQSREIMYVNYVGELFLRMLKSLILPLIMSSLISAIGSLDLSLSGKIGARAIVYYMVTTVTAVITGSWITFHQLFSVVVITDRISSAFFSSLRNHPRNFDSSGKRRRV